MKQFTDRMSSVFRPSTAEQPAPWRGAWPAPGTSGAPSLEAGAGPGARLRPSTPSRTPPTRTRCGAVPPPAPPPAPPLAPPLAPPPAPPPVPPGRSGSGGAGARRAGRGCGTATTPAAPGCRRWRSAGWGACWWAPARRRARCCGCRPSWCVVPGRPGAGPEGWSGGGREEQGDHVRNGGTTWGTGGPREEQGNHVRNSGTTWGMGGSREEQGITWGTGDHVRNRGTTGGMGGPGEEQGDHVKNMGTTWKTVRIVKIWIYFQTIIN